MESEHNTLASASCLGRQPNSKPAPSAFRDNNIITSSMKDERESLIMEVFETIIHNCLTKIQKKKKSTASLKFIFKKTIKRKIKLAYNTLLLTNTYKGGL